MLDKFICIITVSLWETPCYRSPILKCRQITACSSRVVVKDFTTKILQFYKGYFINSTRWWHWKLSYFVKLYENFAIKFEFKGFRINILPFEGFWI